MRLAEHVYQMAEDRAFNSKGDLRSQLQRAALSVSNNIAEGFERGTPRELIAFLYIARGSAGETRSIGCLLERLHCFTHLRSEISDLKSLSESIARQLRGWAAHLQDSDIKGQRHLTEKERVHYRRKQEADAQGKSQI